MSFNRFPAIAAALHASHHEIVEETATDIATTYSNTAALDTGFMRSSAYIVTSDKSTYGQNAGTPPTKDSYLMPEVEKPDNDTTAYVAIGANYAEYLEYGTRYQPAQPAFYPAIDKEQPVFQDKLSAIEPRLIGKIV